MQNTTGLLKANHARKRLQKDVLTDQLDYWKQQLGGAPSVLEWTIGRPRPPIKTHCMARYSFVLPGQLTAALKVLSRREGVSLFMTLAAAFNTLLHRYTGQDDLLIGTVTADHKHSQVLGLMDLPLNTLVLRTNLSGNPTFLELLARVREVSLQAEAHQEVPFEYLVKELQPEQEPEQNPFFQVMLILQPSPPDLQSEWALISTEINNAISKCDLSLILEDQLDGLAGCFEYSTDLFDDTTIANMAGHWQTLLEGIVIDATQPIATLPLLTPAELHQLLIEWNATQAAYPKDKCIHQLFEAQVARTSEAVAVVFEGEQLTYGELNRQANQLAHHLQHLGVGPEVLVGICVERSLDMVVGLLGILKAGGAYVPLDASYPVERLAFMLEDTQAPVLLTQAHLQERLPQHAAQVVYLDADLEAMERHPVTAPGSAVGPNNLAYVLYTSGSTGKPKGVAIEHRSSVTFIDWGTKSFSPQQLAGVLASTSINFDLSVFEIFVPLCCGGAVILCENLLHLSSLLAAKQVTLVNTVPSVLAEFLREHTLPASVGVVNLAGEPLSRALAQQINQLDTVQQVFNLYGPTEDTTYSTWSLVHKDASDAPSIGRPLPGTQVYILDQHLQPIPIGAKGELYLGGDKLARCYLNRPELTAERFLRNPFSDMPGARIYKTGDLARYCADGTIEHLGRLDFQVKIRGFRIELGEIEAVLSKYATVRQAVVVAREDTPGDKRLVAYVVPHQGQPIAVRDLQGHLTKELPAYMMPSAFVLLEALPLTPNGKVDRQALPVPDPITQTTGEPFAAPTSMVHQQLRQIWEELLDVRPIGIRDNFFYLGGHSLLAARLVDQIEQVFGKKLPLATFFAGPTIEQLAQAMQTEEERSSRTPLVAVQANGSRRPFFYLHGAWDSDAFYCFHLAHHLGPDQPFYALAPYDFDDSQVIPTVEEMAAAHIQSLRTLQPEGPYLLGGFCNGGLVAYEMARQLHAEGQRVDLLVLIEPAYPPFLHKLARSAINCVGKLLRLSQEQQMECFLRLRHIYKYMRQERRMENLKGFRNIDPSILTLIPTTDALRQDDNALFDWIITSYSFEPYAGKITLIWAREEAFHGVWRHKTTQEIDIELRVVPGTHIACRTDHVQTLAEELSRCLGKAQTTMLKESKQGENATVPVD